MSSTKKTSQRSGRAYGLPWAPEADVAVAAGVAAVVVAGQAPTTLRQWSRPMLIHRIIRSGPRTNTPTRLIARAQRKTHRIALVSQTDWCVRIPSALFQRAQLTAKVPVWPSLATHEKALADVPCERATRKPISRASRQSAREPRKSFPSPLLPSPLRRDRTAVGHEQ